MRNHAQYSVAMVSGKRMIRVVLHRVQSRSPHRRGVSIHAQYSVARVLAGMMIRVVLHRFLGSGVTLQVIVLVVVMGVEEMRLVGLINQMLRLIAFAMELTGMTHAWDDSRVHQNSQVE